MKKFYPLSFALFMVLLFFGSVSAQNKDSTAPIPQNEDEKVYKQSEVDQKAKIIKRYFPATDGMCGGFEGSVKMLVILHKSGKVGNIKFISSSDCQRFNENSLSSTKKIKFNPAIKDGQPVSVSVVVEYTYHTL